MVFKPIYCAINLDTGLSSMAFGELASVISDGVENNMCIGLEFKLRA